jgi:hypothetical protein
MRRHALLFSSLLVVACNEPGAPGSGEETGTTETTGGPDCGESTCASDEYCDWLDNKCGTVPDTPMCRPRPEDCGTGDPVCGCDGEVHPSECAANVAGTDLGEFTCEPPAGMFACGTHLCTSEAELCQNIPSDGSAPAAFWLCLTTPPGCLDNWSCACIQPVYDPTMACSCTEGGELGVLLTCPP